MSVTIEAVEAAIATVKDPEIGRTMVELGMIRDLKLEGSVVSLGVDLTTPACPMKDDIEGSIRAALKGVGVDEVHLDWGSKSLKRELREDDPCPGVANIVLVMSGKGGVGKSTIATNVALALKRDGCRVGLLDADMYGPSIPTMLGITGRPGANDAGQIKPLERFGIKMMSIGFLLDDDKSAVIWRGPMLQAALMQFLKDVQWGELDYLVLDLPPGTGDVVLTLSQRVRATGAVMVTTPQEVALADVYKACSMLEKVEIPLLGVVENESYFVCDGCDKRHEIFGTGGGAKVAAFAKAPLLAQIPIDIAVREWGDMGTPLVQAMPDSPAAIALQNTARKIADRCSVVNAQRAPKVRIDRSGGTNRHLPIAR